MVSTSLGEVKTLKRAGRFTEAIQIINEILSKLDPTQRSKRIELLNERSSI